MKHILRLALRHLSGNRVFTGINILGTSLSLLALYLLTTYVLSELSFDKTYSDYDRVFRLNVNSKRPDGEFPWPTTPPVLATHLNNTLRGIDKVARVYQADFSHRFSYNEANYIETRIFYADSLFLEILDYPLVSGDRSTALDHPNSILLTRDAAKKYFGDADPMGKQLILNDDRAVTVTGVLENIPATSHLDFHYLASFTTFQIPPGYTDDLTSWRWNSFITYLKLDPGADVQGLEASIRNIWISNAQLAPGRDIEIQLQPVSEIYLNSFKYHHPYLTNHFRKGNMNSLVGLTVAATVLLLIAIFNFTNLSMATIVKRARNISMYKIIGSGNRRLITQFLTEALLVELASGIVAGVILLTFQGNLIQLTGYPLLSWTPVGRQALGIFLGAILAMTALSILYPIIVTKKMKVLSVLKEGLVINRREMSAQHLLIVFQICITAILLSSTLIVKKQLRFMSDKDLGYNSDNVIVVRMLGEDMVVHYERIKTAMSGMPDVISVSRCKYSFDGKSGGSPLKQRVQPESDFQSVAVYESHYDFFKTTGIRLIAGREFSPDFPTDSAQAIVLNQAALAAIGLDLEKAIGTEVTLLDWTKVVVGVVEDFNYTSLHNAVGPLAIVMPFTNSTKLYLKLRPGSIKEQVSRLENRWSSVVPGIPFDFTFLDTQVDQLYKNDNRFSKLIELFTVIGIVTACVGLIAIAWFNMTLRMREIAIRKILGAGLRRIIGLLTRQFAMQTAIAMAFSIPASIYTANIWLSGFAYRIDSYLDAILFSTLTLVLILMGILVYVSGKLALVRPVENLRND